MRKLLLLCSHLEGRRMGDRSDCRDHHADLLPVLEKRLRPEVERGTFPEPEKVRSYLGWLIANNKAEPVAAPDRAGILVIWSMQSKWPAPSTHERIALCGLSQESREVLDLVGLGLAVVDGSPVEGVSEESSLSPASRGALSSAGACANKRLTGTAPTFLMLC